MSLKTSDSLKIKTILKPSCNKAPLKSIVKSTFLFLFLVISQERKLIFRLRFLKYFFSLTQIFSPQKFIHLNWLMMSVSLVSKLVRLHELRGES